MAAIDATAECDGFGFVNCFCAGDFCACGADAMPCHGCENCAPLDEMLAELPEEDRREELAFIKACEQDEDLSYEVMLRQQKADAKGGAE